MGKAGVSTTLQAKGGALSSSHHTKVTETPASAICIAPNTHRSGLPRSMMSEPVSQLCSKQKSLLVFAVIAREACLVRVLPFSFSSAAGCRFMKEYDSRLDLAPRDIVARAIQEQMRTRDESHVLLDIR